MRRPHSVNQIEKHGSHYGILYGIAAYGSWGIFPLYFKTVASVLLGVLFLRERLRPRQMLSIGLALIGVLVLTAFVGKVPWVALTLALTFSFYALMRKLMPVDGFVSLAVETLLMVPVALAYLGYLAATSSHEPLRLSTVGLLMLSGPITTVPLLFFGAAARRLRLSTMGILQYLSPTLQFLLAVLAFGESFSSAQLLSFACIWAAVLIYATDSLRAVREHRIEVVEPG